MEEQIAMSDNDKHKIVNALVEEEVGDYNDGNFASMILKDLVNKLTEKEREILYVPYYHRESRTRKEQPKQVGEFIWKFQFKKPMRIP